MRTVAALYIDPKGVYPKLEGVECWDAARDARKYAGPHPVVAHPPCGPWANLRHLHRRPEDAGLGIRALEQVRAFGGVLEQPAGSLLFTQHIAHPRDWDVDGHGGFCVEVEQVSWGHVARKRTWLYFVKVDPPLVYTTMRTGGTPTHWVSGGRRHNRKGSGGFAPPGIKICSTQQRNRTPPEFARWLVMLARSRNPFMSPDERDREAARLMNDPMGWRGTA